MVLAVAACGYQPPAQTDTSKPAYVADLDSCRDGAADAVNKRNAKKAHVQIVRREDFEELKEDETVDIVGGLPDITANMKRILKEKLGRRNTYAHPSTMTIARPQVDDMITELVNNVVLKLKLP